MRKPGTATVEFMEPISKNRPVSEFMALMEQAVEVRSRELMAEVGFYE
jgi:1-acyl-sn-glycerol-3-phosphate acyltransferase